MDGSMPWPATSPITHGHAVAGGREHVVEVAGHHPGARLVHPAQLEPLDVGQVLGGQPVGPAPGGQLLLGQHLLGPPLQHGPVLGQAGLVEEAGGVADRHHHRDAHRQQRELVPGRVGDGRHGQPDGRARRRAGRCAGPCRRRPGPARWRRGRGRTTPSPPRCAGAARARRAAARPHKAAAMAQNTAAAASHGWVNMAQNATRPGPSAGSHAVSPAPADPEHQRGRAEAEMLADAPLQVPQVGGRDRPWWRTG